MYSTDYIILYCILRIIPKAKKLNLKTVLHRKASITSPITSTQYSSGILVGTLAHESKVILVASPVSQGCKFILWYVNLYYLPSLEQNINILLNSFLTTWYILSKATYFICS